MDGRGDRATRSEPTQVDLRQDDDGQDGPSVARDVASLHDEPVEDAEWWREVARERHREVRRLEAELDALRPRAGEPGGGEEARDDGPSRASDTSRRVLVWFATLLAVTVLGRWLGADRDLASALWFVTMAAVVTVALAVLSRRR